MAGYTWDRAKKQAEIAVRTAACGVPETGFEVTVPPGGIGADLAVPLFKMAKGLKANPASLAQEAAAGVKLAGTLFTTASAKGGFVNLHLDWSVFCRSVLSDFQTMGEKYGCSDVGSGRTVVVDYSSPNIAKPFSVGHLRSTVIGQAICNILRCLGYSVVGDNHIGDWGTQFGKLIVAYRRWGDKNTITALPTKALMDLYVRFHNEAKTDPRLEDEARDWFRRLEEGDSEARELWQWFRDVSLEEFNRVYKVLGVSFDCVLGESYYKDQLKAVVAEALDQGLAVWDDIKALPSENADEPKDSARVAIVRLDDQGIETPLLLQKSDGTSLYATRDIATARYRSERWNPELIVYVVGGEQQLYFRQCFAAFRKMGINTPCVHAWFGLIRLPEGKMSTRAGRVVLLEDLIGEAVRRALEVLEGREMEDAAKQRLAEIVGIGAVKYADLSQDRTKEVVFDWDRMLSLSGDSGPYIQYAHTRAVSILRKADAGDTASWDADMRLLSDEAERNLVRTLARFPEAIEQAAADMAPHRLAGYLFDLAQAFSRFYRDVPVLSAKPQVLAAARLKLVDFSRIVIRNGMALLGIECPDSM